MARGSLLEAETQIRIAYDLSYVNEEIYDNIRKQIDIVGRLITGLLRSAKTREVY